MSNDRSIWAFADVRSGQWNKQMIWQGDFKFACFTPMAKAATAVGNGMVLPL